MEGRETVFPAKITHFKLKCDSNTVRENQIVDFIAAYIGQHKDTSKIIIFCQMKSEVSKVNNCLTANFFKLHGKKSAMIHGDVPQKQRD